MKATLTIPAICTCLLSFSGMAQTPPQLQISGTSTGTVFVGWTADIGTNYQLIAADHIADPFALWEVVSPPITATSTNVEAAVAVGISNAFFKVYVTDGFSDAPTCQIVSPSDSQIVKGTITVNVHAVDNSRLSTVDLFLDGNLLTSVSEGNLSFTLETFHFANGPHIITARALDNVGIPNLGGIANNPDVVNETYSLPITLVFSNSVRWLAPPVVFGDFVEINAESDIYPADWTVVIEDETGSTVQTISGATFDGNIQTYWDGLDANSVPVPEEHNYTMTVFVAEAAQSSQNALFSKAADEVEKTAIKLNQYGMVDCMIEEPEQQLDFVDDGYAKAYAEWNSRPDKDDYPPLPPPAPILQEPMPPRKVPLSELLSTSAFLATDGAMTLNAGGGSSSGSAQATAWKEPVWGSGKILIARQKYRTSLVGLTFNAALGQMLNGVAVLVEAATSSVGGGRGVVDTTVFVCPDSGPYSTLLSKLQATGTRAFYYHGHANGHGIGYSELTPTDGLTDRQLQFSLNNLYKPAQDGKPTRYQFRHPYRFVFIDGCQSATGELPEGFGIPKRVATYLPGKRRAYMGWGSTKQNSIANNDFHLWTKKFWETWLDEDETYDLSLGAAIDTANAAYPTITNRAPLVVFGDFLLTWRD